MRGLLAVGLGGPLATLAASVAIAAPLVGDNDEDDEQSLDEFVNETIGLANTFWAERFREIGQPYRAPAASLLEPRQQGQRVALDTSARTFANWTIERVWVRSLQTWGA